MNIINLQKKYKIQKYLTSLTHARSCLLESFTQISDVLKLLERPSEEDNIAHVLINSTSSSPQILLPPSSVLLLPDPLILGTFKEENL